MACPGTALSGPPRNAESKAFAAQSSGNRTRIPVEEKKEGQQALDEAAQHGSRLPRDRFVQARRVAPKLWQDGKENS